MIKKKDSFFYSLGLKGLTKDITCLQRALIWSVFNKIQGMRSSNRPLWHL
jgi:hypothetical protein